MRKGKALEAYVTALTGRGQKAGSSLKKYASAICRHLGIDPDVAVELGPVKKPTRIFNKAREKYGGDVAKVSDIARMRIKFEKPRDLDKIRRMFGPGKSSNPAHGCTGSCRIKEVSDHFASPKKHGYPSFYVNLETRLKGGGSVSCEIQFVHRDFDIADKDSRSIYEEMRPLLDKQKGGQDLSGRELDKLDSLSRQNIEIWKKSIKESGLENRVDYDGKVYGFAKIRKNRLRPGTSPGI